MVYGNNAYIQYNNNVHIQLLAVIKNTHGKNIERWS
jgi:hypothetical protein